MRATRLCLLVVASLATACQPTADAPVPGPGPGAGGKADDVTALGGAVSSQDADGVERLLFTVPACLPACTESDKAAALAEGLVEGRLLAAIAKAEASIDFSMFTFSRRPIYEALLAAAERGVRVRGIVDAGQLRTLDPGCGSGSCPLPEPLAGTGYAEAGLVARRAALEASTELSAASLSEKLLLLLAEAPDGSGIRGAPGRTRLVHDKFLLVDGAELWTGSGNWSSTAMSLNLENLAHFRAARDAQIVESFACRFELVWAQDAGALARETPGCQGQGVHFSPAASAAHGILPRLLESIDGSRESIEIAMHHLAHPELQRRLLAALERGTRVRLLFDDDDCRTELPPWLAALAGAGAEVRFVPTSCALFQLSHNKFGIFDRQRVINGSGNWSKAGVARNYENFLILEAPGDIEAFGRFFDQAFSLANEQSACACDPSEQGCRERYCLGSNP